MGNVKVKCVVWDIDNTLWNGTLIEDDYVTLRKEAVDIIKELDSRGILHSISSKNDYDFAMQKLHEFNLDSYFLYPQINWERKSKAIEKIAKSINIGIDTLAFIDDQIFEREEVKFAHPEVLCIDSADLSKILTMEQFIPRFITDDSKDRRKLYISDIERNKDEENFDGVQEEFFATLNMIFTIGIAQVEDLKRVEELTVRTHQLNSTGTVYSYEELIEMVHSDKYLVLIAQLTDIYGTYGKIGISVVEKEDSCWCIKLLLMSCRVMSKGVGTVLINYIMKKASENHVKLYADFITTDRNRIMYITYKLNNFKEIYNNNNVVKFIADLSHIGEYPDYLTVVDEFI